MAKRTEVVRLLNCGKQMLAIQVRPPGSDFYRGEQQVRLMPNKSALLPKDHLDMRQVDNLRSRRMLQVAYDSES